MGRGDRFMQKSFSVGMPAEAKAWPFRERNERADNPTQARGTCGECGKVAVPGAAHTDLRDEGRPRQRVCFGKVVAG